MSDNRTPVAANTRSNHPILVTDTSPLPQRVLMDRGEEETKDKTKDKTGYPPPPRQGNHTDSDSDNESTMSTSTDTETDFLKYLEPEYKKFKPNPDLSDVITLERKLGTALYEIQNSHKDSRWSHVVDDEATHKIRLGVTGQYTAPTVPTRPNHDNTRLSTCVFKLQ